MHRWLTSASLLILVGCSPTSRDSAGDATNRALADLNQAAENDSGDSNRIEAATSAAPRTQWRYSSRSDPMNDRPTRTACVWSDNEVLLDFPYRNTRAELCLRDSPQFGRDAYVALEGDGQILCHSFSNCTVRVRFDNGQTRPFPAVGASDNSTNIVFIRARDRLERGLRTAERTAIQIEFYQAGQQALVFPTAGFRWPDR